MLEAFKRWFCRLTCSHPHIINTGEWPSGGEPTFHCFCRECGQTFPPPDKWVEMAERRRLHEAYFPHDPLIPAAGNLGGITDVE